MLQKRVDTLNPTRGKFIQPGKLANKSRVLRAFQHRGSHDAIGEGTSNCLTNPRDGIYDDNVGMDPQQNKGIIVHYGDLEYHDKDFDEDCCFLDILGICRKFVDIYSVGLRFTDEDGRQLQNDADVTSLFRNYRNSKTKNVYVKKTDIQGLTYKLPSDNPHLDSYVSPKPIVTNLKIVGELKVNKKVSVCGDIIDGMEAASIVEFFITMNKQIDVEKGLTPISSASNVKEFELPLKTVGQFVVAKLTPMTDDGIPGDPKYAISETFVESDIPKVARKVRGCNKNKKVYSLKQGEKLDISFYQNRGVGENQKCWSRHLGKIVRDRNICPVRVVGWTDISDVAKKHMWDSATEHFKHPEIESYKLHTFEHMNDLWGNWRSTLNTKYVKPCKSKLEAVKNVPRCMDSKDWEWLVNNLFYTPKFQETSARNAENRANQEKSMTHRCGSKPHREVIYEMGGKEGNPPSVLEVFSKTRKVDENTVEPELRRKYDEIVEATEAEPTLTNIQVVEKCFGRQRHGRVFGYGGGLKRKHFESTSEIEELKAKLREKDETNRKLMDCTSEIEELKAKLSEKDETNRKLMEQFENRLLQMENEREERRNANTSSSSNNELQQ